MRRPAHGGGHEAQLAGMALWTSAHEAMFTGELPPPEELDRVARAAARAFLAAYAG